MKTMVTIANQVFFHAHLLPIHFTRYAKPISTGTSMRGPTVAASAWSLLGPYVATATAIASSKLLLAAVKLWVAPNLYPYPSLLHTKSVKKKMTTKYTIRGAAVRTTETI